MSACRPRPVTLATALKAQGYATGQFGKNHLGDLNKFLPTVHGFDEFFGYLYHLDAMSDPYWFDFPQDWIDKVGPRNLVHCWATDVDDPTEMPRWGKVGKQKIVDEGPLAPFPNMAGRQNWQEGRPAKYNMETFDEVLVESSKDFMNKAKKDGKPFFVWHNTTRMHVLTYLSPKYQAMMNSKTDYGLEEAGMAQLDDSIGALLKHLEDIGEADNTIVIFSTDNGAEVFTWPDGGMTPFKATKGTAYEGGFRVPCIIRWPGHVKPGRSRTASSPASIGSRPSWPQPATPTSPSNCSEASNSAIVPIRTTSMATTRPTCSWALDRRSVASCSTSLGPTSAPCGWMTSSSSSSCSPSAGPARRSRPTCLAS